MAAANRPVNSGAVTPIPLQKFGIVVLITVITIMLTVFTWIG